MIQLPEVCRAGLAQLYAEQKAAEQKYMLALNTAVAAMGLDPRLAHRFNLDTGVIEPAEPPKE